ncbi:MAG: 3-oxoacyl-ACP reductase FabG [Nitrospira sp.]|nr:3-oxoacyl-ACP reductase FabG [Nitrospira sp.]
MFVDLQNHLVLVTGGTRGIGRAIVDGLWRSGAKVAFTFQRETQLAEEMVKAAHRDGKKAWAFQLESGDAGAASELVERIESECGEIYGLVNNAGITRDRAFLMMSLENWDQVVQVNLNGTAYMSRAVLGRLINRKQGKVVNLSSVSGMKASPGQANYSATKAALIALTKTLSHEVARFGIQVNAVAPGFINTEMVTSMPEQMQRQLPKSIPLRRLGRVDEVADAVLYLLSQHADYITGHTLIIDGGLSA